MTDVYGPAVALSYYDKWLADSPAAALHLFKSYSIHPPNDAQGFRGRTLGTLAGDGKDIRHAKMGGARKVARLHLTKGDRGHGGPNEGGDALYGRASYTDADPGGLVYWLPWDSGGAIIQITIPPVGTRGVGKADPDRFFTATINGCSVFVTGTPQNPTVYHAGGDTGKNGPAAQAQFWRDLMTSLGHAAPAETNKEDYIKNSGVTDASGANTTQAAKDYKTWLETNSSELIEIEDVRPWGAVMGIRNAGNWTFYLQENASVSYYTLRKKKRILQKNKLVREQETVGDNAVVVEKKRTVARAIRVSEIFPNRVIPGRIDQPIPRTRHG